MKRLVPLTVIVVLTLVVSSSWSGIPQLINYQGMLTDNSGNPLTDTLNITFKIYNDSTSGTQKWVETQSNVPIIDGLFNVILGGVNPIDSLDFSEDYWLDITVGGEQMPKRLRFTSMGYAYRAQVADTAYNVVSVPSYAQVLTVAQSGGDFTTIGAALAACVSPSYTNRYLIRVMPGIYAESVTCSSFVRLQGAGKYVCRIEGTVTGADSCTIDGFQITQGVVCNGTSPTITHNIITSDGTGISIIPNGMPWIKENEIVDCGGYGIHCNGFGTDAWIIANKIERNGGGGSGGGIGCTNSSPTISNNQILENEDYGIYLIGGLGQPAEPTIDDNVIGRTQPPGSGIGIYMTDYAEPRIIANDIWINFTGIEIRANTQPSILGNSINYNSDYGIRCYSSGATKPVVIKGNYIHSNPTAGLDIVNSSPIVTHNNIHNNDPGGVNPDIQYVGPGFFPMVSFNVVDIIATPGTGATGQYNVTSAGVVVPTP